MAPFLTPSWARRALVGLLKERQGLLVDLRPLGEEDEDSIASHEGTNTQQKPWEDWRVTCMAATNRLCGQASAASSTASATSSARRSQAFGPSWVRQLQLEPGRPYAMPCLVFTNMSL